MSFFKPCSKQLATRPERALEQGAHVRERLSRWSNDAGRNARAAPAAHVVALLFLERTLATRVDERKQEQLQLTVGERMTQPSRQ